MAKKIDDDSEDDDRRSWIRSYVHAMEGAAYLKDGLKGNKALKRRLAENLAVRLEFRSVEGRSQSSEVLSLAQ